MSFETKSIVCGSRNFNGELTTSMPEGFNLESIIKDNLFGNNCSYSAGRYVGYLDIDGYHHAVCECIAEAADRFLISIHGYNYLSKEEMEKLEEMLKEAFSSFDVTLNLMAEHCKEEYAKHDYKPGLMIVTVFARQEVVILSPMLKQFHDLKKKHPDALLLFRCGDFYETYCEDAKVTSEILGITLTKSSKTKDKDGKPLAMAGFPYHALDTYLPKLIRAGKRVAICERLEDPKTKKITKRGISELALQK